MECTKKFGEMMRAARQKKGITSDELAERVGTSSVYCRAIESGKYTPTWVVCVKICTALDIDINKLREICI